MPSSAKGADRTGTAGHVELVASSHQRPGCCVHLCPRLDGPSSAAQRVSTALQQDFTVLQQKCPLNFPSTFCRVRNGIYNTADNSSTDGDDSSWVQGTGMHKVSINFSFKALVIRGAEATLLYVMPTGRAVLLAKFPPLSLRLCQSFH